MENNSSNRSRGSKTSTVEKGEEKSRPSSHERRLLISEEALAAMPIVLRAKLEENLTQERYTESDIGRIQRIISEQLSSLFQHGGDRRSKEFQGAGFCTLKGMKSDDVVGAVFGESRDSVQKRRAVLEAAEEEPEQYGELIQTMDKESVNRAYNKLKNDRIKRRGEEEASQSVDETLITDLSTITGKIRTIYADPPWRYRDSGSRGSAEGQYPTMSVEELRALDVGNLAHEDGCHLWLWTTWPMIRDGVPQTLLDTWGYEWKGEIVWDKQLLGIGQWIRGQTEILILAVKGKLGRLATDIRGFYSEKRGKHSQKPEKFYEFIENFSPQIRLEMFSRKPRDGWLRYGYEA